MFAEIVCQIAARGAPVVVGLEIPRDMQSTIDAYLGSGGSPADRASLTAASFWNRPREWQDGRGSEAMLALLERLRALRHSGRALHVIAFDVPDDSPAGGNDRDRDRAMADLLRQVRATAPEACLLVLCGNGHARTARGVPWDPSFVPMGMHLAEVFTVLSFNAAYATGRAWTLLEGADAGDHPVSGHDRGNNAFVERTAARSKEGYDGVFYVGGPTSASPPAVFP
jgi:hypothetical protein